MRTSGKLPHTKSNPIPKCPLHPNTAMPNFRSELSLVACSQRWLSSQEVREQGQVGAVVDGTFLSLVRSFADGGREGPSNWFA